MVRLKPAWVKGHTRRGAALSGLKKHEEARKAYLKACEFDPANAQARELMEAEAKVVAAMLAAMQPLKPGHPELIAATNAWLAGDFLPEIDDLYAASPYSRRQTQRLVERYFGLSPVALRRKYRALRAATLLSLPSLTMEYEAQIGQAFYDQPHMIREIRLFAGRTPARIVDPSSPYLTEMLNKKNLRQVGLPIAMDEDANDSQESETG